VIIIAAFAVVAFSIFAQGLTMPWLIRVLGLTLRPEESPDRSEVSAAD
jgi:CPA1 family monovalent cation:H+ antiporter